MNASKLLILGVLASCLCMTGSVFGQCAVNLDDSAFPTGGTYNLGETIVYELCVAVPEGETNCTLENVCVYFFPPGSPPSDDACDDPVGEGILLGCIDVLAPGDPEVCFEYEYEITVAGCDAEELSVTAYMAVNFDGPAGPDCDRKTLINFVNPVESPPCGIVGPPEICATDQDVLYCSQFEADSYEWEIIGNAVIDGPADGECVLVDATGPGGFLLTLTVCTDNGLVQEEWCCTTCEREILVVEAPPCDIEGPLSICEDGEPQVYCSGFPAGSYEWDIDGDGEILDTSPDGSCVLVGPTGPGSFTLHLRVCSELLDGVIGPAQIFECCSECELTVDVVPTPECPIDGPENVCENTEGIQYCVPEGADSYSWSIEGNGEIIGPTDGPCVIVDAGEEGSFLLTVVVCNDSAVEPCCNECELEVTVEGCGVFCTFTQGFYGNAGGKACDGTKTKDLIDALIDGGSDPVIVGVLGVNSITLDDADCIIKRLPAGGTPMPLPAIGDVADNCDGTSDTALADVLKKQGRYNNVLIGQVVALTLNLRLYDYGCDEEGGDLAGWVLPAEFCTMGDDGCPQKYEIPESLVGLTVGELLEMANDYLAGLGGNASAINTAVSSINEGFDECREVMECPTEEICDNGCDDDFDGAVDCADEDCVGDPACII